MSSPPQAFAWCSFPARAPYGARVRVSTTADGILRRRSAPPPGLADGGRRAAIHRAKCGVEPPDAREARGEGDRGHREGRLVDQRLRALHPAGRRDGCRRGASVALEQPAQMPSGHAERICEILDGLTIVEEASLEEPHRSGNRCPGAPPCRAPRRRFRTTPQAGAESRSFGGGRGGEEHDVLRLGRLHRTGRAAIDSCGQDTREEPPVEPGVARDPRAIASSPVENESRAHGGPA